MEHITSRKNKTAVYLRKLGADASYRRETGLFLCDGEKLLREAISAGVTIDCVIWQKEPGFDLKNPSVTQFIAPAELVEYVSPLKNTTGPVFSVKMGDFGEKPRFDRVIILENVQDPGNVGTILRTALAMKTDAVVLVGGCADIYNPKTVRSTMGAVFRQPVLTLEPEDLSAFLAENKLPLYGAALTEDARDIRSVDLTRAAVAVGSEGGGLSKALLSMCDGRLIIPMLTKCQSLNAAVAAAIIMWEMCRND